MVVEPGWVDAGRFEELVDAIAAWVGTDPRGYLRSVYTDERGRVTEHTPESIVRYLASADDEYWPDG